MTARGDVILKGGRDKDQTFVLALTMGALAQLEREFNVNSYVDALAKFKTSTDENGRVLHPSMNDLMRLIYCLVEFDSPTTFEDFSRVRFTIEDIGAAMNELFPSDDKEVSPSKADSRPPQPHGQGGSTSE
jgi:hypothetical protein